MAKILDAMLFSKRHFDPFNDVDRQLAIRFIENYTWVGVTDNAQCPFICEWPYLNIPAMLKDRLLQYFCRK